MPPYRLARLSDEQLMKIEALENEIGTTLIAYEPAATAEPRGMTQDIFDSAPLEDVLNEGWGAIRL